MRFIAFLFTILLSTTLSSVLHAQESNFTLEDAVLKRFTEYYPERPKQLQWLPEVSVYSTVGIQEAKPELMIYAAEEDAAIDRIPMASLNEWLKETELQFERFPQVAWIDASTFVVSDGKKYAKIDRKEKTAELFFTATEAMENISFNHLYTACVYTKNGNLFYQKLGEQEQQITTDGGKGIVYGSSVHRNEFGISGGLFWAPDGEKIAYYRMDESMVTDYPIENLATLPATISNIKYPMAGGKSHHVTLDVYNPINAQNTRIKTGKPDDQYLTAVTWDPQSELIFIGLLNRDQNHLKLNMYSAETGDLKKTLFEEQDEAYVEPEHGLWFLPKSNSEFIWMSEQDGFNHLYVHDIHKGLQRQLTQGMWEVERIIGYRPSTDQLIVEGTGEVVLKRDSKDETRNAMHRFTYVIDYQTGNKTILNDELGTHRGKASDDGNYIIEDFSSIKTPWKTSLYSADGEELKLLLAAADPTEKLGISKPELIHFHRSEATLYGRIIKPSDFDPNKKYPLMLYVYGGPHAQLVQDYFLGAAPLWMYWLAEQGVVVATVDNRGSDNRGIAFEQTTFRNLGVAEMTDQKDFVDYLIDQGHIDQDRMVIHGWSYGGFMTMNMLLTYPGLFQAGIAGGPVCDWSLYEIMYTERYMDTPESNPTGYKNANLVERAPALKDDLLLIHGTSDDVVVWQHSKRFVKACIDAGVQLDYFMYPGHAHNVRGKDRYHLMEKVLNYALDRIAPEEVK